jgi:hypothetical protein
MCLDLPPEGVALPTTFIVEGKMGKRRSGVGGLERKKKEGTQVIKKTIIDEKQGKRTQDALHSILKKERNKPLEQKRMDVGLKDGKES